MSDPALDADGLLVLPQPIDAVDPADADPVLQAAEDELAVLRLELADADAELDQARRLALAAGADPAVIAGARSRLDELIASVVGDAELHAAALVAGADQAGTALVARAEEHAAAIRSGGPITAALPALTSPVDAAAPTLPAPPTPGASVFAPAPLTALPSGWVVVPQSALVPLADHQDPYDDYDDEPPRPAEPYAKTLGLLQVTTWSILVAAVLVVLFAWFA